MQFRLTASILILLALPGTVSAVGIEKEGSPARKLQRGFLNIAFAPVEISNELDKVKKRDEALPSWVEGIGRGAWFAAGRALVGAYEMVTFAIPFPSGYEPVIKPEFAWEHLPPAQEVPASLARR